MSAPGGDVAEPECNVALVDAHVHFYPCFERDRFLDAARRNFDRWGRGLGLGAGAPGVLLMTESRGQDVFDRWRIRTEDAGRWRFRPTREPVSLLARREDGASLTVVAGRQLRTREDLEVLALATRADLGEGGGLREILAAVGEAGGLPVIPWGFGKWWFRRGGLVRSAVEAAEAGELFLGDNGGRPWWYPRPRLFTLARSRGLSVLPGSDPLPFPGEEACAGSYGAVLHLGGLLSSGRPARDLVRALRSDSGPTAYGEGETTVRFLRHQLRLQLRKRGAGLPRDG